MEQVTARGTGDYHEIADYRGTGDYDLTVAYHGAVD